MAKTLNELKDELLYTSRLFYATDFKEGGAVKYWWTKEFKKASCLSTQELKEWAEIMMDYLYDFKDEVYYLRDEVELLLKDIIEACELE